MTSVRTFILHNGFIPLLGALNTDEEFRWEPPGGRVEGNLTNIETAVKENLEEAGLNTRITHHIGYGFSSRGNRVDFYVGEKIYPRQKVTLNLEVDEKGKRIEPFDSYFWLNIKTDYDIPISPCAGRMLRRFIAEYKQNRYSLSCFQRV